MMRGFVGNLAAVAVGVVAGGQELTGLNNHFADMLVTMHAGGDTRGVVQIEDVHGYLSRVSVGVTTCMVHQSAKGVHFILCTPLVKVLRPRP